VLCVVVFVKTIVWNRRSGNGYGLQPLSRNDELTITSASWKEYSLPQHSQNEGKNQERQPRRSGAKPPKERARIIAAPERYGGKMESELARRLT